MTSYRIAPRHFKYSAQYCPTGMEPSDASSWFTIDTFPTVKAATDCIRMATLCAEMEQRNLTLAADHNGVRDSDLEKFFAIQKELEGRTLATYNHA